MRIRSRIRHLVGRGFAADRIEFADGAVLVAGEPRVALVVEDHGVRQRVGRQGVFPGLTGDRIKASDQIAKLTGVPDRAIRMLHGITAALSQLRQHPFSKFNFEGSRHRFGCPVGVGRKIRRQVIKNFVLRVRLLGQVDHHRGQRLPVITRIPRAVLYQRRCMAGATHRLDQHLAFAFGHRPGFLRLRRH